MAKDKYEDYSSTAASNTDIAGINIDEGCAPAGINNALRAGMAQTAAHFASDTIASAATTDLGSKAAQYLSVTGTTTITAFGTIKAGTVKFLRFAGALTLTHNATSLIIPGAANITTAAGDLAIVVSEGSGNWRVLHFQRAAGALQVGKGTAVASAATTALGEGTFFHITGTTTITDIDFANAYDGRWAILEFDGALTLTHHATTLTLPGGANITTAAGDRAMIVQDSGDNMRVMFYQRAAAEPVRTQAWELITKATVTTNLQVTDLSAFRTIRISGKLVPATDGVSLYLRTDTNNGASFDAGASDYAWQISTANGATAAGVEDTADNEIQITGTATAGNETGEGVSFELLLTDFNQANYMFLNGTYTLVNGAGAMNTGTISARRLNATARDAFLLFFSSGNASGQVIVEGVRG